MWKIKYSLDYFLIFSRVFLEKAMATHPSTLAWKIPWEEPDRLQSTGSLRVGHDWAASLSLFTFIHWRKKGQPTPVFLPGESQGWGSLVGCRLWGRRVRHDWSGLAERGYFYLFDIYLFDLYSKWFNGTITLFYYKKRVIQ